MSCNVRTEIFPTFNLQSFSSFAGCCTRSWMAGIVRGAWKTHPNLKDWIDWLNTASNSTQHSKKYCQSLQRGGMETKGRLGSSSLKSTSMSIPLRWSSEENTNPDTSILWTFVTPNPDTTIYSISINIYIYIYLFIYWFMYSFIYVFTINHCYPFL